MAEFADSMERMIQREECSPYEVGYISPVAVRQINEETLELSWYPNTRSRFHEVSIILPRNKVKVCVACEQYDVKPYIFVDNYWLEHLYLREYSVFSLIDAISVKDAIRKNLLTKEKLIKLRTKIDELAVKYEDISFISFADSLILKSNWDTGYYEKEIECSYHPEIFLTVIKEIEKIYRTVLGLEIYAVLTQGSNEYYGESLLHISDTKNHICLNSLGVPFAELLAIENSAKLAFKSGIHPPMQLYMDEQLYHSLRFKYEFKKNEKPNNTYKAIMKSHQPKYYYSSLDVIIDNLEK